MAQSARRPAHDPAKEPLCGDAPMRSKDPQREVLSANREQEKRAMPVTRRPGRRALGRAERGVAARRQVEGGDSSSESGPSAAARGSAAPKAGQLKERRPYLEDTLAASTSAPPRPLSEAERTKIEARYRRDREHWDAVYERLMFDSQACARAMGSSPELETPAAWQDVASRSLDDYRSGRALMDHLGAARLLDPATTGMLLAIRRGLIAETNATSMSEYVLIDMAVVAFANAMRVQSIVGNTALLIEGEMFGQPTLRAKWKRAYDGRSDIEGLAVDEHVAQLRDRIVPLIERFHRLGRESIDALTRARQAPSASVERAEPLSIVLAAPSA
jgi:hypothetical protein